MMSVIENTPPSPVRRRQKSNFERSPFLSDRKRTLFPTTSPHGSDLSEIIPLSPISGEFCPSKSKVVVRTPLVPTSTNQNITPKKSKNPSLQESPRRSPRLAEKQFIKTSSFYGRSLLSEFSKTTSVNSSLKTKLFQDKIQATEDKKQAVKRRAPEPLQSNPIKKKCTSKSSKKSSIFSGVGHGIRRPNRQPPSKFINKKRTSLRQSLKSTFDFTKTPYSVKKDEINWSNYAHIHRERQSLEENSDEAKKRKFFKSNVKQISVITPPSCRKKCKLFKVKCDEILADPEVTASDLLDLIEGTGSCNVSANLSDLTESASNLSIDDAVKEAESSPMRELVLDTPKTPGPEPEFGPEATPESESEPTQKIYPVFNFKKKTQKSSSPKKLGATTKGPRKVWHGVGENQLLIDAGQKQFGTTQCAECGLMYEPGNAEDEMQHASYHSNYKTLRYPGYKNERIVGRYGLDIIVCFSGSDSKISANKIQSVLAIVDAELGFDALTLKLTSKSQVYLYVIERRIVGCLVAEPISTAHKIGNEGDVNVCSTETYSVKCGISRIWTCATYRRQGIATKLMDCLRRNFFYGSILAQESIAFSVPSVDGKKFASHYTGKQDYFVYTGWKH